MIDPFPTDPRPMASGALQPHPHWPAATVDRPRAGRDVTSASAATTPEAASRTASVPATPASPALSDPILCGHCGRTASNGISCIGMCVADSGY